MPHHILFDIDGTLVDSVDLHAEAWQVIFRKYGKEIEFKKIREQIGKGGDQLLPVFWSRGEIESFGKEMEDERSALFLDEYMPRVKAFPKVPELFRRILDDGKKIALATSAKDKELKRLKEIAGINGLFDEETSSEDAEKSKPHPDIFIAALEQIGDPGARDSISIGDTPWDAIAAGKTGLKTVGMLCGGCNEDTLLAAGCVAIYRDPADLLARYDESPLK